MTNQKKRIAEFLDGIIDPSLPLEEQMMLFSQEGVEGAGVAVADNSNCANNTANCGGSTNRRECTNYNNTCGDSTNMIKCTSTNDASCQKPNFSTASCGGQGGDS